MYIKLEIKAETDKAYQLQNDSWIPKSVLNNKGLKQPYYKIEDWWLSIQVDNIILSNDKLKIIRKKYSSIEKQNSINVMKGIEPLVISFKDIPLEIQEYHTKYFHNLYSNVGCYIPNYEPRMYGNECFDGDPYLYGQS